MPIPTVQVYKVYSGSQPVRAALWWDRAMTDTSDGTTLQPDTLIADMDPTTHHVTFDGVPRTLYPNQDATQRPIVVYLLEEFGLENKQWAYEIPTSGSPINLGLLTPLYGGSTQYGVTDVEGDPYILTAVTRGLLTIHHALAPSNVRAAAGDVHYGVISDGAGHITDFDDTPLATGVALTGESAARIVGDRGAIVNGDHVAGATVIAVISSAGLIAGQPVEYTQVDHTIHSSIVDAITDGTHVRLHDPLPGDLGSGAFLKMIPFDQYKGKGDWSSISERFDVLESASGAGHLALPVTAALTTVTTSALVSGATLVPVAFQRDIVAGTMISITLNTGALHKTLVSSVATSPAVVFTIATPVPAGNTVELLAQVRNENDMVLTLTAPVLTAGLPFLGLRRLSPQYQQRRAKAINGAQVTVGALYQNFAAGTEVLLMSQPSISAADYGADASAADNYASFQAHIQALTDAGGGAMLIPTAETRYTILTPLKIDHPGITVIGDNRNTSVIYNPWGSVWILGDKATAVSNLRFVSCGFTSAGGGAVFEVKRHLSVCWLEDFILTQSHADYSIWHQENTITDSGLIECHWQYGQCVHNINSTVAAFKMTLNALNYNTWRVEPVNCGVPFFDIINNQVANWNYDNSMDLLCEICDGGIFRGDSDRGWKIRALAYDNGYITHPMIALQQTVGGQSGLENNIEYIRHGGALAGAKLGADANVGDTTITLPTTTAWANNQTLSAGQFVRPTVANKHYYKVITGGTLAADAVEPTWSILPSGNIVKDGLLYQEQGFTADQWVPGSGATGDPVIITLANTGTRQGRYHYTTATAVSGNVITLAAAIPALVGLNPWWSANAYALNTIIAPGNGHYYKATTAGTSGSSAPAFNTGAGSTTTDGSTLVWTEIPAAPLGVNVYKVVDVALKGASNTHSWRSTSTSGSPFLIDCGGTGSFTGHGVHPHLLRPNVTATIIYASDKTEYGGDGLVDISRTNLGNLRINGGLDFEPRAWTSSGRPAHPLLNMTGINSDNDTMERWNGLAWVPAVAPAVFGSPYTGYFFGYSVYGAVPTTAGALVANANEVQVARFMLPFHVSVRWLTLEITTPFSGAVADVGLYDSTGNLICNTAGISCTSTVSKVADLAQGVIDLYPYPTGSMFLAWTCTSSSVFVRQIALGAGVATALNPTSVHVLHQIGTAANPSVSGILPATLGAIANGAVNPPLSMFSR